MQPTTPPDSPRHNGCLCFKPASKPKKTTENVIVVANGIVASPAGSWNTPGKFTPGGTDYKPMPGKEEGSK